MDGAAEKKNNSHTTQPKSMNEVLDEPHGGDAHGSFLFSPLVNNVWAILFVYWAGSADSCLRANLN